MSVVIPTHSRPEALRRSLAAVLRSAQALGRPVEVIVVDEGIDPETAAVTAEAGVRRIGAAEHGARGPGQKRNVGVRAAAAPIVAFTDDDTEVAEDWLSRAVGRIESEPGIAGLEGAVQPVAGPEIDAVRARVVENRVGGAYLTANLVLRRAAFDRAGGFRRLRVDPHPRWDVAFREDTDLALRVIEHAGPVPFDAGLVVHHPVEAAPLAGHLRTALLFEVDEAFRRLHPHALPSVLRAPTARLRIRSSTLAVTTLPLLLFRGRRGVPILALAGAVLVQHAQIERELAAAGVPRSPAGMAADAARRTPRAAAWALTAGAARLFGAVTVAAGRVAVRSDADLPAPS